jgi:hypothetical protein
VLDDARQVEAVTDLPPLLHLRGSSLEVFLQSTTHRPHLADPAPLAHPPTRAYTGRGGETKSAVPRNRRCAMAKDHGPSVKDDEQYETLRRDGASKEKAARIANGSRSESGKKGGNAGSYEDWSKNDLTERAAEIGIEGRSDMTKDELIDALRNH